MGYYMGDFYGSPSMYRGPGRGDPGFFSFLGGLAKKAVSFIPGIGPAASAVLEHIPTASKGGAAKSAIMKAVEVGKGAIIKHPVMSAAGAAGAIAAAGYETGKHRTGIKRALGGGQRKRRRMNPCNVKALRRASRRAHAFLRLSNKLVRYYQPHKKKGRAYIKHKKRAA